MEYPTLPSIRRELYNAMKGCVDANITDPLLASVAEVIGPEDTIRLKNSIFYSDYTPEAPLRHLIGSIPLQQVIGFALRTPELIKHYVSDVNSIVNVTSMNNTTVKTSEGVITVKLVLTDDPVLRRYLRFIKFTDIREVDGLLGLYISIVPSTEDVLIGEWMSTIIRSIPTYIKLLERFNKCRPYSTSLPSFQY